MNALKTLYDFTGRATRTEFNYFILANVLLYVVVTMFAEQIGYAMGVVLGRPVFYFTGSINAAMTLVYVGWFGFVIAWAVAGWAVATRRVRDIGWSFWTLALAFVPLAGFIFSIMLMTTATDDSKARRAQLAPALVPAE